MSTLEEREYWKLGIERDGFGGKCLLDRALNRYANFWTF